MEELRKRLMKNLAKSVFIEHLTSDQIGEMWSITNGTFSKIKVESSNLEFVSYAEDKEELSVWFKSRKAKECYIYKNVSVVTFSELMKSESKGKYFIANIKGNEFRKE